MTREEAIQILSTRDAHGVLCGYTSGVTEALDMAIEALSQPIVCKDYCIDDDHIYCSPKVADRVVEALSAELTVQTPQKYGKSINPFDAIPIVDLTDGKTKLKAEDWVYDATPSDEATQTDLVQRSDVLEVLSDAQDGSGSTYNILQPIFVKVNNLPSCHRCDECDEQFYQQILEKGMIELPQEYVSVVRCKDCRLAQDDTTHLYCGYFGHKVYEDDFFCAYGERREP